MNTHITILAESLEKKSAVLQEIIQLNETMDQKVKEETFDFEAFDRDMEQKGTLIARLDQLDEGFESVYEKVRDELIGNSDAHREEIARIQESIRRITDQEVRIRAQETRLKQAVKSKQQMRSAELMQNRNRLKASQDYYRMMNKLNINGSPFMDKKQ
ncbi:MAG: hypothetical protein K6G23_06990 [Lachnospiraceae bacterium]|nr:hypothetical protein [Lachnospiraceae bacterium]